MVIDKKKEVGFLVNTIFRRRRSHLSISIRGQPITNDDAGVIQISKIVSKYTTWRECSRIHGGQTRVWYRTVR